MVRKAILLLITLTISAGCSAAPDRGHLGKEEQILEHAIRELAPSLGTRYSSAYVDLNGDDKKEAVVYMIGPEACGSGGCPTLVFSPEERRNSYRLVSIIELTRPPVVAAKSTTHGWRDLVVSVAGGGILEGYNVVLPFNGASYPESPFLDRAHPLKGKVRGELLIQRRAYDEAKTLRSKR